MKTSRSSHQPPPRLRRQASEGEWAGLGAILGFTPTESLRCVLLDPRGKVFQRLEWWGDSVLDLLGAFHIATTEGCCAGLPDLTSDDSLAKRIARAGVTQHLDWAPSPERLADWAEVAVAAAFDTGRWELAAIVAGRLVHSPLAAPRPDLGPTALEPLADVCQVTRNTAALGAQVVEAAVSLRLAAAYPAADEGELTQRRRGLVSRHHLVETAAWPSLHVPLSCRGDLNHEADHVQWQYGAVCIAQGFDAAIAAVPH